MGEDANIQPAFGAQILLGCDATGFEGGRRDPAALDGLQSEITEDDPVTPGGLTFLYVLFGFFGA
jgi:hypothetical protein